MIVGRRSALRTCSPTIIGPRCNLSAAGERPLGKDIVDAPT